MKEYLTKLSRELRAVISRVSKVSQATRMPAYLVGGGLRDLILGVNNFDLDIAVEGDGIIFAQELSKRLKSRLIVHDRFRTATLIIADGLKVDIATARQEKYLSPAALPVVSPGTLREDLKRRDFTVNAMALSLAAGAKKGIIDPFGGQVDLAAGKIRILHNLSFKDDPTRIFRALRFSQRFDFKIEPATLLLLKEAISLGYLNQVNPQRLREELILVLKEQNPWKPIKKLGDWGALSFILSRLKISKPAIGLFKSIDKEISGFIKKFPDRRALDAWLVYFTALLAPLTLAQIKTVTHRLGLSKGQAKRVLSYYQVRGKVISSLSRRKVAPQRIFSLLEPLSYETIILLSATSQNKNFKKNLADFLEVYNGVRLCVSGRDLGNLGILPGPEYERIFAKVLTAKLNGRLKNRQAELVLIRKLAQAV